MKAKKYSLFVMALLFVANAFVLNQINAQNKSSIDEERVIDLPDIPGYQTLKCDLHIHTVLSDGEVWPSIRVQEALRDGIDAISVTDHIEYQPHKADIPHPDRNRGYEIATKAAGGSDLIVINGTEITRGMPPGHCNAIFVKDVNKLNTEDPYDVFVEAKKQGAFVFWNHPHWTAQKPDGIVELTDMHKKLLSEGLINGIEIVNDITYSDEALEIARENNLTLLGTSDIHGLVDWQYYIYEGGHRPVTLTFVKERSEAGIKEALVNKRTAVWYKNSLFGDAEYLVPLTKASLIVKDAAPIKRRDKELPVVNVTIYNQSDVDFILENLSEYTFHASPKVVTLEAHKSTVIQVKTVELLKEFELKFKVLNAYIMPDEHPEVVIEVK